MIYPSDIYMSPRKAIQRFAQILQRCHPEAVKIGNNYREEKEALITAEVLYGIEEHFGGQHWLQNAEYVSPDIDIKVISKIPSKGPLSGEEISLQITEFETHNDNFIEVLTSKQKPGYKPGKLELIISVRDKLGWKFYPDKLAEEVSQAKPEYSAVWLIADDSSDEWEHHLNKLFPDLLTIKFNVKTSIDKALEPDFIRILPKYGRYTPAEDEFELALPPCPICGKI